ncbi:MAG: hypothetical protein Q4G68_08100 [Planctomycetia bacterium]|nr:hypothetical protein [Planctomycetia bacterium]
MRSILLYILCGLTFAACLTFLNAAGYAQSVDIDDIQQFSSAGTALSGEQNGAEQKEQSGDAAENLKQGLGHRPFDEGEPLCDNENELVAECLEAMSPWMDVLSEYEPSQAWVTATEEEITRILLALDDTPQDAMAGILRLEQSLDTLDSLKAQLLRDKEPQPTDPSSRPRLISRYNLNQRLELIDSLRLALERRIYLWSEAVLWFQAQRQGLLIPPQEIAADYFNELKRKTEEVRDYFGTSQTGRNWRRSFEVDLLLKDMNELASIYENRQQFNPVALSGAVEVEDELTHEERIKLGQEFVRDRINSICFKIGTTPMTESQKEIFTKQPLAIWTRLLAGLACDQVPAHDLLWAFEQYETIMGADAGRELADCAWRMKTSVSDSARRLGAAIDIIYNNPNTKVFISEVLINRLLPIRDPEFDVVQEMILNNPVAGRRRTDTQVAIRLVPDPQRLLMNLTIDGKMVAATSSSVFPATVYNESFAVYRGQKTIEWKDNGILYSPTAVAVDNASQLSSVQSDIDFVPVLGDLVRGVAKGQYELKQSDIQRETKARIEREVRARIDQEANQRFDATNIRLHDRFFGRLDQLGLSLKMQNSRTTNDWLLASIRLAAGNSLGSQSIEPPTLPGAFADLKVHESAINTFLGTLELAGGNFSSEELILHLAQRLNMPALANVTLPENDLFFQMRSTDPVTVRFFEDRIQIYMDFESIEINGNMWHDVTVIVSYRPQTDLTGTTSLVRDGLIQLEGPLNIRAQVPLRAIFSKVFPADKAIPLVPGIMLTDERFTGLSTGLARVSRGWFAMSIIHQAAP